MKRFVISLLFISLFIIGLISCIDKKEKKDKKEEIGEYLYVDQYSCMHIKQNCIELMFSGEDEKPNYMVKRVPTKSLYRLNKTCSHCVTDEIYKKLIGIIEENKQLDLDSIIQ